MKMIKDYFKTYWNEVRKGFWLSLVILNSIDYFKYSIIKPDDLGQTLFGTVVVIACIQLLYDIKQ